VKDIVAVLQAQAGTDPATVALMCAGLSGEHVSLPWFVSRLESGFDLAISLSWRCLSENEAVVLNFFRHLADIFVLDLSVTADNYKDPVIWFCEVGN
jgi:hypothetical protein